MVQIKRVVAICEEEGREFEVDLSQISSMCRSFTYRKLQQPGMPVQPMQPPVDLYVYSCEFAIDYPLEETEVEVENG